MGNGSLINEIGFELENVDIDILINIYFWFLQGAKGIQMRKVEKGAIRNVQIDF